MPPKQSATTLTIDRLNPFLPKIDQDRSDKPLTALHHTVWQRAACLKYHLNVCPFKHSFLEPCGVLTVCHSFLDVFFVFGSTSALVGVGCACVYPRLPKISKKNQIQASHVWGFAVFSVSFNSKLKHFARRHFEDTTSYLKTWSWALRNCDILNYARSMAVGPDWNILTRTGLNIVTLCAVAHSPQKMNSTLIKPWKVLEQHQQIKILPY